MLFHITVLYEENFELRRVKVRRFRSLSPCTAPTVHGRALTTEAEEVCTLMLTWPRLLLAAFTFKTVENL